MQNILSFLNKNFKFIVLTYLVVQLIYIFFFPVKLQSDSLYYFRLAQDCIKANSFYPAPQHLYEDYIIAPLYINILFLILKIYNSTLVIRILNVILNSLQLLLLYKVSAKIFNKDVAIYSSLIYIFYLNNLGIVLLNYTELLFGVLILASIYFYLSAEQADLKNNKRGYFVAGIFAAASIGVRPLGWALILAYIIIYIFKLRKNSSNKFEILRVVSGLLIFILFFGSFNYIHFHKFIYTSTTGSSNLLMGANDKATGAFNSRVFDKGEAGYIENPEHVTYQEKEDYWRREAVKWIKEHPFKWISLIPVKLFFTFAWDDISISALANEQNWDFFHIVKYIIQNKSISGILPDSNLGTKLIYFGLQIVTELYYYIILFFIIVGILLTIKSDMINSETLCLMLFALFGILITIIVYGIPRYKYSFLICLIPFAAFKIENMLVKTEAR
jgi:Dolichyl-phosphate-mannose-protein mannosyltransferase